MCEIGVGFYCCICVQYEFFYYNAQVLYTKFVFLFLLLHMFNKSRIFLHICSLLYFLALIAVTFTVTKSLNRYVIGF